MISDPFLYKVVYNYLVQPLDSIFIDGEFRTPSTDYLQDMYESKYIQQFLFGDLVDSWMKLEDILEVWMQDT